MAKLGRNPDAFKWRCGRCQTWNDIRKGTCRVCGSAVTTVADAFRIRNELTAEEENFYRQTGPAIVMELRNIKNFLAKILSEMRSISGGTANEKD